MLTIPRDWDTNRQASSEQLDDALEAIETFVNGNIDSDSVQANSLTQSLFSISLVDNVTVAFSSGKISLKDLGVSNSKIQDDTLQIDKFNTAVWTSDDIQISSSVVALKENRVIYTDSGLAVSDDGTDPLEGNISMSPANTAEFTVSSGSAYITTTGTTILETSLTTSGRPIIVEMATTGQFSYLKGSATIYVVVLDSSDTVLASVAAKKINIFDGYGDIGAPPSFTCLVPNISAGLRKFRFLVQQDGAFPFSCERLRMVVYEL